MLGWCRDCAAGGKEVKNTSLKNLKDIRLYEFTRAEAYSAAGKRVACAKEAALFWLAWFESRSSFGPLP